MSEAPAKRSESARAKTLSAQPWQPLFSGAEAAKYQDVAREIATALADPDEWKTDGSLAGGQSGTALLFAYRHLVTGSDQDLETALCHLNAALEKAADAQNGIGLHGGLTGVGYAATFIHRRLLGHEGEDPVGDIDEVVESLLKVPVWSEEYDLIGGLVGLGVYALERLPDHGAQQLLVRIIDHLEATAVPQEPGIAWLTPPERVPEFQREAAPLGYLNLGVAHGLPGVVSLLGNAVHIGILPEKSRTLLAEAVNWLLHQPLPPGSPSVFPTWVPVGDRQGVPSRVAWCYGDLGIAAVLLSVARMVGEESWEAKAIETALHAAAVPPEDSGVVDAGLCHGSAGLAHLFNRMYQATGEPGLGEAARYWFQDSLERRRPGEGVAGFCSYAPFLKMQGQSPWETDPGFLSGAAGIAMAFLAATTDQEPVWDDVLLVGMRQGDDR